MSSGNSVYERDFYTWALEQARALQERRVDALDWENLSDEVGGLARSEARTLRSQLARLLAHLLKWQLQSALRTRSRSSSNSWRGSVEGARDEVRELLDENPGLKPRVPELFAKGYKAAVNLATEETGLDESKFPASCPWTFEQAMDEGFWPDSVETAQQPTRRAKKDTR
jgi:hypothetical protein